MADDLIRKSDVLETYADLYDIFDDNKAIQEELHKVFDKINNIPSVESSNSEIPNNSTISKMEQVDKDINVRSKDEPQTEDDRKHCVFCKWVYESNVCDRCRNMNLFADAIEDEPQTCETCKYGKDKHKYAHICNECGVGINNYEPRMERNE